MGTGLILLMCAPNYVVGYVPDASPDLCAATSPSCSTASARRGAPIHSTNPHPPTL